jgi:2,3-dihydroxybenzoate-AMP ligase
VVLQLPNSIEFVVTFLALTRLGAIPVMALRAHRYSEIRHFVEASGAVAYMVPGLVQQLDFRQLAAEVQRDCPSLSAVFVLDDPCPGSTRCVRCMTQPAPSAEALVADT